MIPSYTKTQNRSADALFPFSCSFPLSTLSGKSSLKDVVLSTLVQVKILVLEDFDCHVRKCKT